MKRNNVIHLDRSHIANLVRESVIRILNESENAEIKNIASKLFNEYYENGDYEIVDTEPNPDDDNPGAILHLCEIVTEEGWTFMFALAGYEYDIDDFELSGEVYYTAPDGSEGYV